MGILFLVSFLNSECSRAAVFAWSVKMSAETLLCPGHGASFQVWGLFAMGTENVERFLEKFRIFASELLDVELFLSR